MKCPGQDPRFWKFDAIFDAKCPNCGNTVEFFKDETRRRCQKCSLHVLNPKMDFGCAAHCKFAEQCFGDLPPELIKQKQDLFKDRVAIEMKMRLKNDFKRIGRGSKAARYIEKLAEHEPADPAIAMSVAYLNEVVDSCDADPNCASGIKLVKDILDKLDAAEPLSRAILDILEGKAKDEINYKIYQDALKLVEIEQQVKKTGAAPEQNPEENGFFSSSARELVKEIAEAV